jgi:hypothetical protein
VEVFGQPATPAGPADQLWPGPIRGFGEFGRQREPRRQPIGVSRCGGEQRVTEFLDRRRRRADANLLPLAHSPSLPQ